MVVIRDSRISQFYCLRSHRELIGPICLEIAAVLERFIALGAQGLRLRINYGSWLKRFAAHAHILVDNRDAVIARLDSEACVHPAKPKPPRPSTDAHIPIPQIPGVGVKGKATAKFVPSLKAKSLVEILRTEPTTFVDVLASLSAWHSTPTTDAWDGWGGMGGFGFEVSDVDVAPSVWSVVVARP